MRGPESWKQPPMRVGPGHRTSFCAPHQIKELFLEWLRHHVPNRASQIESLVGQTWDKRLYDTRVRKCREGPLTNDIAKVFKVFARQFRMAEQPRTLSNGAFAKPRINE